MIVVVEICRMDIWRLPDAMRQFSEVELVQVLAMLTLTSKPSWRELFFEILGHFERIYILPSSAVLIPSRVRPHQMS